MKTKLTRIILPAILLLSVMNTASAFRIEEVDFDSMLGLQTRLYDNNGVARIDESETGQRRHEFLTVYFQQAISYKWNKGRSSIVFNPYFSGTRYEDPWKLEHDGYVPFIVPIPIIDFGDVNTTHAAHADLREFLWTHVSESRKWELRTGVGKVFWGVTESQHLVDVINQDDLLADIDGEEKLGQPMVNLTLVRNWGNLDIFVLPGFRERVYQENVGRLTPVFRADAYADVSLTNPATMINRDAASWESGAEELHTDFALRWSHNIGISDVALSFFQGTNRDPVLGGAISEDQPGVSPNITAVNGTLNLVTPYYEQMTQVGLEYQATPDEGLLEGWLFKFEGIYLDSDSLKTPQKDAADGLTSEFTTDYTAFTAGFEYTFTGVFDTPSDLGFLMEYSLDSRDFEATTLNQNDLFVGFRFAKNSTADASILAGISQDLDIDSYVAFFEASRRLGNNNKLIIEGMTAYDDRVGGQEVTAAGEGFDPTTGITEEGHIRIAWETYF